MRTAVDLDRGQGNGVGADVAPEVFEVGPDGSVSVPGDQPVPHRQRAVRNAARRCPARVVTVPG